jgi:Protein of unknown function (DUF3551)
MKSIHKMMTAAAAFSALAVVALAAPAAQAGEYCSVNSSGMRGCGFESLAQCQASMAGQNGTCMRDPYLQDARTALAYQPTKGHRHAAKPQADQ